MAGHSAWKNIKHRKAARDAKRGKAWSKCARALIAAARAGGGDIDSNITLRAAVDEARYHTMPRETIENAIKKGTGELGSVNYESAMYEGYGPGGVAILMEILTDNRNRSSADIKCILDRRGGNLGASGCVAYAFTARGQVLVPKSSADEDTVMSKSLDAGAIDVRDAGDFWQVLTEATELAAVRKAMDLAKLTIESAHLTMIPSNTVPIAGEQAKELLALIEELDENEDVQKVHTNFEISEAELAALGV